MSRDDLQQVWQAQSQEREERLPLTPPLQLLAILQGPHASLRASQAEDVLEAALALVGLAGTGAFLYAHKEEPRFEIPAAALHAWLVAVIAVAVARFVRKAVLRYDTPVLVLQRQLQSLQAFTLRAQRALFVSGCLVWGAPCCIVLARAFLGWDLYQWPGLMVLLSLLAATGLLALTTLIVCAYLATRLPHSPRLQQLARNLAGYNLMRAQERLAQLSRYEEGR